MSVQIQFREEGQPESTKTVEGKAGQNLLEIALFHDVDLDHACGGVCACSTCHVKVLEGSDLLNESSEDEEDQLDDARDVSLESRLGCQAKIQEGADGKIVVVIPAWNVNAVQEGHH